MRKVRASLIRLREVPVAALAALFLMSSLLTVAGFAGGAPGADERYWPQWRGPRFNGVSPHGNPPLEWSETQNVAWKVEIPGNGYATPIVWEDKIFVLSAVPASSPSSTLEAAIVAPKHTGRPSTGGLGGPNGDAPADLAATPESEQRQRRRERRAAQPPPTLDFTVLALSRADGSVLWRKVARRATPHEGKQTNNSWASSSAITDGERVFAFFGSHGLYAYDMHGTELWSADFGDMTIRNGFGEGATPVLHGDRLIVVWDHQGDSFIAALDKTTGDELWRRAREEPETWATPLVVEVDGRAQVITPGEYGTYGYDLETGDLIWEGPGLTTNPIPSPVSADGVVYLMSGYRGNALRAVRLADAVGDIGGSSAILWEYNQDTPYVPSPLLYGQRLYFLKSNSPILTAFDVHAGQLLYGPQRVDELQEVYASPVGAAGRVYLFGRDGGAVVIEDSDQFRVLATNSLDDGFEASPAVVGSEIYVRGRRFLYRIEEAGGPDS